MKAEVQYFVAADSPAFRCKSSLYSGPFTAIRLKNKVGGVKKYKFICENHLKSAEKYLDNVVPTDLARKNRHLDCSNAKWRDLIHNLIRFFCLKAEVQYFVAAGSPAFRCKSSLYSGLFTAIRLKNKVGGVKKYKFICENHLKSAGTRLAFSFPLIFARKNRHLDCSNAKWRDLIYKFKSSA
ncbi:hypothetical protein [Pedobacter sp.]|uniref:hypothetical protein n=1 Tax=Pedobacter sp. TaxID=1411316 RepID=UPI0031D52068